MRIISLALWGNDEMYCRGAIENAQLALQVYPGWTTRVYATPCVPGEHLAALAACGATVIRVPDFGGHNNSLARFRPLFEEGVERVIFRDCDSRINLREAAAVNEWIAAGAPFHIMRDHPYHTALIMAGMCGSSGRALLPLKKAFWETAQTGLKGIDQIVLEKVVYPYVKNTATIHDSFFRYEPQATRFPTARTENEFVGEALGARNERNADHVKRLEAAQKSVLFRTFLAHRSRIKALKYNLTEALRAFK
jgi:protein O-GlcNAc transferase